MKDETGTTLKEIIVSLICSIDLISFFVKHHHQRVAVISKQIGEEYGLSQNQMKNLVLAASLHDIGAISARERDELIRMDTEEPEEHARLGGMMLQSFPYFNSIIPIIKNHHCRWDRRNEVSAGDNVPIESYILHLADRIDILIDPDKWILDQKDGIRERIKGYSGTMFMPELVDVFIKASEKESFWLEINHYSLEELLNQILNDDEIIEMDQDLLDAFALTISHIIDFRSSFTATHSTGVGAVCYELGRLNGFSDEKCKRLRIAGFLHDLGKVAIPKEIIDKATQLSLSEYNQIKAHSYYTNKILGNIKGISDICLWASMHHERYDGTGYPYGLKKESFCAEVEIVAYSDVFTALRENRQYRKAYTIDQVLYILDEEFKDLLGEKIFKLIKDNAEELDKVREAVQSAAMDNYMNAIKNI